jgi:HindVP restriction endonuclease
MHQKPGLFGISNSNRDFSDIETWGKNQFNSSFPAALGCYMHSKNLGAKYLILEANLSVAQRSEPFEKIYGLDPTSRSLFFSFESQYSPYRELVIGDLPRVDLVTQNNGTCLNALEVKLTALPDNTTCSLEESSYSCELVVRPDTIVYLACSIAWEYQNRQQALAEIFHRDHEVDYFTSRC